ncbi:hypothetical protein GCM10023329_11390 [Streptomyces sanyensis]|uniref:Uncharacterized protein n=1 Tax=Streptomyces sanyensis TaxID=568869 RepID=A0ABP8ZVA8_9ACTN
MAGPGSSGSGGEPAGQAPRGAPSVTYGRIRKGSKAPGVSRAPGPPGRRGSAQEHVRSAPRPSADRGLPHTGQLIPVMAGTPPHWIAPNYAASV